MELKPIYINPFTDFGFKKLFGNEQHPEILIDFLNQLLPHLQIITIKFKPNEHLSSVDSDRRAIFDLFCENEKGEKFIVELQKVKQNYFKDRSIFYSTFAVQEQAISGDWNFQLKAVYTIAILDFVFNAPKADETDLKNKDKVVCHVQLMDTTLNKVFYDKLTFVYLQMPNFKKTEKELATRFDKWLFLIKNMSKWETERVDYQEDVFTKILQISQLAKLSKEEREKYETSLKIYRDTKNSIDTAKLEGEALGLQKGEALGLQKGEALGLEKGKREIAKKMLMAGIDAKQIAVFTNLSIIEINDLKS